MYVFLAVAPCRFRMGDTEYNLSAGSTFTISEELGEQLRQPNFPYRKYLKLMSKLEDTPIVTKGDTPSVTEENEEKVEVILTEPTVETEDIKPKARARTTKKVEP